jgi:hypothetical protein
VDSLAAGGDKMSEGEYREGKYSEGDWVRFYRMADLVIAEVRYIRLRKGRLLLLTNRGEVEAKEVIEIRRLAEYIKGDD